MNKVAVFNKVVVFKKSEIFTCIRGHLAVYKNERAHKFCFHCCYLLEATKTKLENHYNGQHKGEIPKFLGFDEIPVECIYSDFE